MERKINTNTSITIYYVFVFNSDKRIGVWLNGGVTSTLQGGLEEGDLILINRIFLDSLRTWDWGWERHWIGMLDKGAKGAT